MTTVLGRLKKKRFSKDSLKKNEMIILAFFIILLEKKKASQKEISHQLKDIEEEGAMMWCIELH